MAVAPKTDAGHGSAPRNLLGCDRFVLTAALAFYACFIYRTAFLVDGTTHFTLIDDAMISMRYARHLSDGYGLVWNAGEAPIQGFTNLAWTLYMAALHVLPLPDRILPLAVMLSSALVLLALVWRVHALTRFLGTGGGVAASIAAAIVAFYFPLVFWSLRGMEVGLSCLLAVCATLQALRLTRQPTGRDALGLGLLLGGMILIRIDLLAQVAVIIGYLFWLRMQSRLPRRALVLAVLLPAVTLGVLLVFQARYFDSLLPNTYHLKMDGVDWYQRVELGARVFLRYALGDVAAMALVVAIATLRRRPALSCESALLLALFGVQCMYSVYVGGDYAEPLARPQVDAANRFVTQGMPFLIVLFAMAAEQLLREFAARPAAATAVRRPGALLTLSLSLAALALASGRPWAGWLAHNAPLLDTDISRARLGIHLRRHTASDAVIAVHAAGQIPYFARRQAVDLLGKSDAHIAHGRPVASFRPGHNKWDYGYSVGQLAPDVIADQWGQSRAYLLSQPQYVELGNGIFIRADNTSIDRAGLALPY